MLKIFILLEGNVNKKMNSLAKFQVEKDKNRRDIAEQNFVSKADLGGKKDTILCPEHLYYTFQLLKDALSDSWLTENLVIRYTIPSLIMAAERAAQLLDEAFREKR